MHLFSRWAASLRSREPHERTMLLCAPGPAERSCTIHRSSETRGARVALFIRRGRFECSLGDRKSRRLHLSQMQYQNYLSLKQLIFDVGFAFEVFYKTVCLCIALHCKNMTLKFHCSILCSHCSHDLSENHSNFVVMYSGHCCICNSYRVCERTVHGLKCTQKGRIACFER